MIKVKIIYKNKKFESLEVSGHANFAPSGSDLVCSAVSAVLTGGFNNIKDENSLSLKLDNGYASITSKGEITKHDEIVIETIIVSLKTIEESYPKFIEIKQID